MNIGVPSRFACLKVDDDEVSECKKKDLKTNNKPKPKKAVNVGTKETAVKKNKQNGSTKKDKKKSATDQQWEEWNQRDNAMVEDQYEGDLKSAMLLSKLEFERNKKLQENGDAKKNNKKKGKAIPLNEFLNGSPESSSTASTNSPKDDRFFKNVSQQAVNILAKEKLQAEVKEREENIDERITIAQYQEKLEKEKGKNKVFLKEIEALKDELKSVKARNKALCDMLGHGEMKDKASVLSELERLNSVKNELTDEVTRLHGLLEQERSKVASLSEGLKHKDKKNKKHA